MIFAQPEFMSVQPHIKEPPADSSQIFVNSFKSFILKSMETSGNKTTSVFWV